MMVVASDSAMAVAMARVPLANSGFSNTPMGPFQTTVLAFFTALENSSMVLGPMSRPCQPSGILPASTVLISVGLSKSLAITVSTGSRSFTPLAFADSIISLARPTRSSSSRESPISPPMALENV